MNPTIQQPGKHRQLDITDHSRDSAGLTYVYPVVSRRAGGVSVGINLNPNNACNWRCIYCQVPNLTRGAAPPIDLALLETELRTMLRELLQGDFMASSVAAADRHIEDVAFSGNGEPTSAREFVQAVALVMRVMDEFKLLGKIKLRLITNGSLLDKATVRQGIARLSQGNGEVWFKLDAGTASGMARINSVDLDPHGAARRLRDCSALCATWVQTCCFALDEVAPDEDEILAWLDILTQAKASLAGVHLYGLARPSLQAEAPRLTRLPPEWLEGLALRVRALGLTACVNP
ncbi:MAG: radical SAM protein [Betaproteobacteria bacterium]|nr:radical SAM protein [Betaproteobacteria bacterium]